MVHYIQGMDACIEHHQSKQTLNNVDCRSVDVVIPCPVSDKQIATDAFSTGTSTSMLPSSSLIQTVPQPPSERREFHFKGITAPLLIFSFFLLFCCLRNMCKSFVNWTSCTPTSLTPCSGV